MKSDGLEKTCKSEQVNQKNILFLRKEKMDEEKSKKNIQKKKNNNLQKNKTKK